MRMYNTNFSDTKYKIQMAYRGLLRIAFAMCAALLVVMGWAIIEHYQEDQAI